jgi:hypothetical protein
MQTDQTYTLTDIEVVKALWDANIPSAYHKKTDGLHRLNQNHRELAEHWLPDAKLDSSLGKTIECRMDGVDGMNTSYLLARALVLKGLSVSVMALPRLASLLSTRTEPRSAEALENLSERDFLFVLGGFGKDSNPYPNPLCFEVEWMLRHWMSCNKCLFLQGDGTLDLSDWWSSGFRNIFNERKVLTFDAPAIRLAKGSFAKVATKGAVSA